jgi:hypothetical protein
VKRNRIPLSASPSSDSPTSRPRPAAAKRKLDVVAPSRRRLESSGSELVSQSSLPTIPNKRQRRSSGQLESPRLLFTTDVHTRRVQAPGLAPISEALRGYRVAERRAQLREEGVILLSGRSVMKGPIPREWFSSEEAQRALSCAEVQFGGYVDGSREINMDTRHNLMPSRRQRHLGFHDCAELHVLWHVYRNRFEQLQSVITGGHKTYRFIHRLYFQHRTQHGVTQRLLPNLATDLLDYLLTRGFSAYLCWKRKVDEHVGDTRLWGDIEDWVDIAKHERPVHP